MFQSQIWSGKIQFGTFFRFMAMTPNIDEAGFGQVRDRVPRLLPGAPILKLGV